MSELHLSLLVIGLVFIGLVFLFNRWQERKFRKQTEKMFRGERQDVLFDEPAKRTPDERVEPSFQSAPPVAGETSEQIPPAPPASRAASTVSRAAPPVSSAPERHEPAPAAVSTPEVEEAKSRSVIDEAIDLIGTIHVGHAVSAETVKGLMARSHAFSKPVHWEGLDRDKWTEISTGGHYSELKMALQLADRRGPATSADISRFIGLVKQFAVELGGSAQAETEQSAAARATELDGFCADVDVEIGVNLVASGAAMPGTKVRALAEASGLKLNNDGVFHCQDEHGAALFTLRNSEPRPFVADHVKNITTHGITLLLDVPRVAHGVQAFDRMLQLGRQIAHSLGGEVVDDNRKPLTDAGADSIRRQLGLIYREMDGYGIPAGSPVALRLFS